MSHNGQLPSQSQSDLRKRQPEYRRFGNLVQRSPTALDQALQPWTLGGIVYTWSKLLDYGSGHVGNEVAIGEGVLFPQVRYLDKALAGFDIASNFKGNVTYHIPAFNNT